MNRRGQMAIFIALIFQVLFVLFAMAINVALVVHDKINLQNAVDLAAYYAAERQAEMLNVIAHENYMIRQSWKLLSWRYRVLGSAGVRTPWTHPVYTGELSDTLFSFDPVAMDPTVCVIYAENWNNVDIKESLCKKPQVRIPPLPQVKVIAGFLGYNVIFARLANQLRMNLSNNCNSFGAFNYYYAAASLQAFRVDQHNRKLVIYALANNLNNGSNGDFSDLEGNSVQAGAAATFSKNLTFANSQTQVSFELMNSLQGLRREQWLSEMQIAPAIRYMDPEAGNAGTGCQGDGRPTIYEPQRPAAASILVSPLSTGGLGAADLVNWSKAEFLPNSPYQYSLGFEKNPWVMAYMGVKAETAPRQIFFPFGSAIRLTARAYAKPFGGRIGPWYGSRWPRGADRSVGAETDPLVAPRLAAGGLMNSPNDPRRLPNYSRYPGDTLGLRSKLALNGLSGFKNVKVNISDYQHVWLPMDNSGAYNDILALDAMTLSIPAMRKLEIAAIAPDLFDATYYSIEPNFAVNYLPKLKANRVKLGIPGNVPLRGDLGMNDAIGNLTFSVQTQIDVAAGLGDPPAKHRPEAYYFIRDKVNLLTGWASGEMAFEYSAFPFDRFGQCAVKDDPYRPEYKVPGSCMARGGRTGYSVKLLARDALFSNAHPIGGTGEAPGLIVNPPPTGSGW